MQIKAIVYTLLACSPFFLNAYQEIGNEREEFFEAIEKGQWLSENAVLKMNDKTFKNFCEMCGMSYLQFLDIILDKNLMWEENKMRKYAQKYPERIREYTEEERTAIFVYLCGYRAILMQYAEEMKEIMEKHEAASDSWDYYKQKIQNILSSLLAGNGIKGTLIQNLIQITQELVWDNMEDLVVKDLHQKADWEFLFFKRIEKAEACQLMNIRPKEMPGWAGAD